jgi:hypothetical protein
MFVPGRVVPHTFLPVRFVPVHVTITPGFDGDSWHADCHFGANGSDKGGAGGTNSYASGEKYGAHENESLMYLRG